MKSELPQSRESKKSPVPAKKGRPSVWPFGGKKRRKRTKDEPEGMRETVEAIVVAFILAFLFRTFEAEAFVIPTGSMAPTLYGRHKDVTCPECSHFFSVGASEEVKANLERANPDQPVRIPSFGERMTSSGYLVTSKRLQSTRCPNCRFEVDIRDTPVYKGDRILVNKQHVQPKRFEVTVFKYPEEPQVNYIKRLVGLPGETIRIEGGDLFARKADTEQWQILRKEDPEKQAVLQQLVHDDASPATRLLKLGWPTRWAGMKQDPREGSIAGWTDDPSGWAQNTESRSYTLKPTPDYAWLRYRHFVPTQGVWRSVVAGQDIDRELMRPRLIADFCSYNAYSTVAIHDGQPPRHPGDYGAYWVNDLTVNASVTIESAESDGDLILELSSGFQWFRCHINPSNGLVTLSVVNRLVDQGNTEEEIIAKGSSLMRGSGTYDVCFSNVDDRLVLWLNGSIVEFDDSTSYRSESPNSPQQTDLIPVGIAARGVSATVTGLTLKRDVYYRAETVDPIYGGVNELGNGNESHLGDLLDSPEAWTKEYTEKQNDRLNQGSGSASIFKLNEDEFLVLGDNSPRSKDSRLFDSNRRASRGHKFQRFAVPRNAIIGKAFFTYWPHAIPFMNDGEGYPLTNHATIRGEATSYPNLRVPFYPQIGRMKRIR